MMTLRGMRRLLLASAAVLLITSVGAGLWLRHTLRASLPLLEGELALPGPRAPIRIERDARGRPTLIARSRHDLAFGLGFLHGQERFFQMDLSRRRAAGELAELAGPALLAADRAARVHRFRERLRRAVAGLPEPARTHLRSYTAGVNAGLEALGARPPSYVVLRESPRPWRDEDTLLVVAAMYLLLQDDDCRFDRTRAALADRFGPEIAALFAPVGTPWDAPIEGSPRQAPRVPGPDVLDLRSSPPGAKPAAPGPATPAPPLGSNGFVVAGSRTGGRGALLACDMHLPLGVPATWYYVSLALEDERGRPVRQAAGVTLPGTPALVAGSNGDIAWGFTNAYADTCDLVLLDPDPADPDRRYLAPGGSLEIVERRETIAVAGSPPQEASWRETAWGPLVGDGRRARTMARRWVGDLPGAIDTGLERLFDARSIEEALDVAHRAGIPAQNIQIAARDGRIAWTIAGRLPARIGFDGSRPVSFADGTRRWDGLVDPDRIPQIVDPPDGLIVTANARAVDGAALALLGDGGYALGARARQIREGLADASLLDEPHLFDIQLDDRAVFLERWQRLLLAVLERHAGDDPLRGEMRALADRWGARASVDSAGYRIVRAFRDAVHERVLSPFLSALGDDASGAEFSSLHQREAGVWALVRERPVHLLHPRFESWDALLLDAADTVAERLTSGGRRLAERTWGERNTCRPRHPLSAALPGFARRLVDMPAHRLPGDAFMPRVQGRGFGASERLVVAPGREREGIFHMPCGASGHFLSPYYRSEHEDWAAGRAVPFLPGQAAHRLVLRPAAAQGDSAP